MPERDCAESAGMRTVVWRMRGGPFVAMIDQSCLPGELRILELDGDDDVADAIRTMVVRGAPAIGASAALGLALAAWRIHARSAEEFRREFDFAAQRMASTRPTAVNLFWAIDRMRRVLADTLAGERFDLDDVRARLEREACTIVDEDEDANRRIGGFGADLIPDGARILTHCNAGALACVAYGTALGVIRAAVEQGKRVRVYADETRPRLQGMKLTAWELMQDGINVTIIPDNAAGYLMSRGEIDCAVVGADRIAANGDAANKIGTYSVAVLAEAHGIPFYVAAPMSTVDFSAADGAVIPIEERDSREITEIEGVRLAPAGAKVLNYAFDVTPARLIDAIVTDKGVARAPFAESLARQRDTSPQQAGPARALTNAPGRGIF